MPSENFGVWTYAAILYGIIYATAIVVFLSAESIGGLMRRIKRNRLLRLRRLNRRQPTQGELSFGTPQLLNSRSVYDFVHAGECPVCGVFDWRGVVSRQTRCVGPLVRGRYLGCGAELVVVIDHDGGKWLITWEIFSQLFSSEIPCTAAPCEKQTLENIQ